MINSAEAISFKDHTGYIPNWAIPMGQNQALSTCLHVDYQTQDGAWCSEFSGYVVDHLNDSSQNGSAPIQTSQSVQTAQSENKMFGSGVKVISKDAYINKLYDFNIIPPNGWKLVENVKLLGGGVGLVGFYANGNYVDYAPNFIIDYKDLGTSLDYMKSLSDADYLDSIVQGILSGTSDSQAKILNKNIQSFSDGRKITVDLVWTAKMDDGSYTQLEKELVIFMFDTGKEYSIVFVAKPNDFDQIVDEFRNSLDTFFVGSISTISGISGTYVDSENGFKIVIPDGWYGVKSKSGDGSLVVFPNNYNYTAMSEGIGISISKADQVPTGTASNDDCKSLWIQYLMLNGAQARKEITQCSYQKFESYRIATNNGNLIRIAYFENISNFEKNLQGFEKLAWSLNVDHPGSTKDVIRHQGGYKTTMINMHVGDKSIPVRFDSTSNITSAILNETNSQVSINLNQVDKNESLVFSVSKVLNPPYSVTIDGKNARYDTIDDKIENVVEISVDYSKGTHDVVIQGSPLTQNVNTKSTIPQWIKNNAKWWHEGSIGDDDFEKGIQYLINQKVIKVSEKSPSSQSMQQVPIWVKNLAGMWTDGKVSDDDFLKGVEYLVKVGIIKV